MVVYWAISWLLTGVISTATGSSIAGMDSLFHSEYSYSAIAGDSTADNAYYRFAGGISFILQPEASVGLNGEVIMQTAQGVYTDLVDWNTDRLDQHAVAISRSLANKNDLQKGDLIYSKHLVDGRIHTYTIQALLPTVTSTRSIEKGSHTDGIILMGYDELYTSNMSHTCIIFTEEPVDVLTQQCSSLPEAIVYRQEEVLSVLQNIAPYLAVYLLVGALCTLGLVSFLTKAVSRNFKRLVMLGHGQALLNRGYYSCIWKPGFLALGVNALVSAVAFMRSGAGWIGLMPVLCVTVVTRIVLFVATAIANRSLWRK